MDSNIVFPFDYIISDNESAYAVFTARAMGSRTSNQYDIVLFDFPITNIGNNYNKHTSNFVCPFHGIYSFSVSFYARQSGGI